MDEVRAFVQGLDSQLTSNGGSTTPIQTAAPRTESTETKVEGGPITGSQEDTLDLDRQATRCANSIHSIPPELLEPIFRFLLDPTCLSYGRPPLMVGQVCASWRAVASSVSELSEVLPLVTREQKVAPTAAMWQGKAARLCIAGYIPDSSVALDLQLMQPLRRIAAHLTHLELLNTSSRLLSTLASTIIPTCTALLSLKLQTENQGPAYIGLFYILKQSKSLRDVELECFSPVLIEVPLSKLRRYVERSARDICFRQVLVEAPELEDLAYHSCGPNAINGNFYMQAYVKPFLTRLNLDIDYRDLNSTIRNLDLPALTHLRIASKFRSRDVIQAFGALVVRSGCTLKTLSLLLNEQEESDLTAISNQVSSLRCLEVTNFATKCWEALSIAGELDIPFLPHLRELICHTTLPHLIPDIEAAFSRGSANTLANSSSQQASLRLPSVRLQTSSRKQPPLSTEASYKRRERRSSAFWKPSTGLTLVLGRCSWYVTGPLTLIALVHLRHLLIDSPHRS